MNRIFYRAYRKLGGKKVKSKARHGRFSVKAMGLTGQKVEGIDIKDAYNAVDELVETWDKDDALGVVLTISIKKGVRVKDKRGVYLFSYKIYNIAYCTVSKKHPEVFFFVARGPENTTICHAFYCRDEFFAKEICLSMSSAFHRAMELWIECDGAPCGPSSESKNYDNQFGDIFLRDDVSGSQCSAGADNRVRRGNRGNGRSSSTLSEGSTSSFGSQTNIMPSVL